MVLSKLPLVSVVMPVFNAANFLKDTIQSVLDQTWTKFELIIIDDGSTDSSVSIAQTFVDSRIVLIQFSENLGVVAARNAGVSRATGEFVAFIDADDIAHKTCFESQIAVFLANKILDC